LIQTKPLSAKRSRTLLSKALKDQKAELGDFSSKTYLFSFVDFCPKKLTFLIKWLIAVDLINDFMKYYNV